MAANNICPSLGVKSKKCPCTYTSCRKRGKCCDCLSYHRARNEIPACFFPPEIERTFDRSIKRFIAHYSNKG